MFQQHSFLSIGTIDEVNQEINMIWVQPRVLDLNQVLHNEKPTLHIVIIMYIVDAMMVKLRHDVLYLCIVALH